jgi:hypothetical protein
VLFKWSLEVSFTREREMAACRGDMRALCTCLIPGGRRRTGSLVSKRLSSLLASLQVLCLDLCALTNLRTSGRNVVANVCFY